MLTPLSMDSKSAGEKISIVDITEEILGGSVPIDPESMREANIDDLIAKAIKEAEAELDAAEAKASDGDESGSDNDDRDVTNCPEEYVPSILHITSSAEISRLNKQGVQFLEDAETDKASERVERHLRLSSEQLMAIASNPKVQSILNRMRPEQVTPEIVAKLLRMN